MTVPRKTRPQAAIQAPPPSDNEILGAKRVRLLASLNLIGGIGLALATPFALIPSFAGLRLGSAASPSSSATAPGA